MIMKDEQISAEDLLERREVASILGVSGHQVNQYRVQGVLPTIRFSPKGRHRYLRSDVEKLLQFKK